MQLQCSPLTLKQSGQTEMNSVRGLVTKACARQMQTHEVDVSQVFYRTHIIAFVAFMVFGAIHHYQIFIYSLPGETPTHRSSIVD